MYIQVDRFVKRNFKPTRWQEFFLQIFLFGVQPTCRFFHPIKLDNMVDRKKVVPSDRTTSTKTLDVFQKFVEDANL